MYGVNNISKTINSVLYSTNENLSGAGDLYIVRDLRTRARKEPGQTVSNKNLRFYKVEGEEVSNFNKDIYEKDTYFGRKIDGYRNIYIQKKDGNYYTQFTFFEPTKKENWNEPTLAGYWRSIDTPVNINKVLNYHATPYRSDDNLQLLEDRGRADGVIHRNTANINTFYGWIPNAYNKELRQNAFKKFYDERLKIDDKYYSKYQKKLLTDFYLNPKSFKIRLIDSYSGGKTSSVINDSERDEFIGLLKDSGLSGYGDKYTVIDNRKRARKEPGELWANKNLSFRKKGKAAENYGLGKPTIKFEFENNEELKNFLKENKENLIDSEVEDAEIVEDAPDFSRKSLRGFQDGKPASIFNCPESSLVCKGFVPTYKKLESYNHLIDDAAGENLLVGYGFDKTTKELLIDTVNKYYKQVYKLAEHLKADTVAQTCFNIWHWEHCNLKYNYDSPGKEEIRTPARTWKDRFNGIDCDCLAVFTASILKCLGFPADFEIVAFNGSDKYAHIFITCAGVVIDRVLPIFNQRAPLITKTLKMQIPVYSLNGLSGSDKAVIALSGLYSSTLSKIFSHTATADDVINHRKTQLLLNLADKDNNGYRFAVILMPFVKAIDDSGAFYFDNSKIADIAKKGEAEIISLERRNATEAELSGLFKKIGKAIKNAAKSVGNAVKTVAKGTVKAATSVVKSTANVVKSSANLVKAGVQAATGSKSAAKSTLRKAVSQAKSAVVDPVKTSVSVTKNVVKATVVEPTKTAVKDTIDITKETVKIAGKLFKVILIKINPVTILIRNSLRLLIAINFLGLATRLNVANMTESEAAKVGVSAAQYKEAKTAYDRVVRFFVKWGGKKENIERAIRNGAKRKALFKKDYNKNSKIVETGADEATLSGTAPILCGISGLGEGVTIASALAAVGAFIAKIWGWVKNIVVKVANVAGNVKDKITQFTGGNSNSNGETSNPEDSNIVVVSETEENNNNKWLVPALVGGGLLTLLLTSGGRKKK